MVFCEKPFTNSLKTDKIIMYGIYLIIIPFGVKMKILIIGAGAIGGSLACYLSTTDNEITLLEKNKEVCEAINRDGITLRDKNKTYFAKVRAVSELGDEKFDCCFSATRAYHMKSAVLSVLKNVVDDGLIISMNNGVCIEPLLDTVSKDRAVWCSINFGAGIEGLGKYFIKIHGGVVMGKLGGVSSDLIRLKECLGKAIDFTLTDNIVGALYSKMLINSCITSTAVLSGLTLGEILSRKSGKKVFYKTIREGVLVAKKAGITIPNYGNKLNYYTFSKKSLVGAIYRAVVFPYLKKKYGERTSATLVAMKSGVKSEIDYFNGYVVSLAQKYGVDAPMNKAVVENVKAVEENLDLISAKRLETLAQI